MGYGVSGPQWWTERLMLSLWVALWQAGTKDSLCVHRPSVIAQLLHVFGYHIEEEGDKSLRADTGHWRHEVSISWVCQGWTQQTIC